MIRKFKSQNLLGESREEEKSRMLKERIKLHLEGKSFEAREVRRGGTNYLLGTTEFQRERRRKLLK